MLSDPGHSEPAKPYGKPVLSPLYRQQGLWQSHIFVVQSHDLCTRCLRFVPPLLTTTQDSLPAGCQPLPDGAFTHWVPTKGFEHFLHTHPPFPGFAWRDTPPRHAGPHQAVPLPRAGDAPTVEFSRSLRVYMWFLTGTPIRATCHSFLLVLPRASVRAFDGGYTAWPALSARLRKLSLSGHRCPSVEPGQRCLHRDHPSATPCLRH